MERSKLKAPDSKLLMETNQTRLQLASKVSCFAPSGMLRDLILSLSLQPLMQTAHKQDF